MLFNSAQFLIFFPIVVTLFFAIPHRMRWILLLAASYYFYMSWNPLYILIVIAATIIDFNVARFMSRTDSPKRRFFLLWISLATNLGVLFFFKYYNFFADSIEAVFSYFSLQYQFPETRVLLPIGVSFYTFQSLGYIFDVYRGKQKPENHLGIFALFVAYFPQLVAGPIERARNMLPQYVTEKFFDYPRIAHGLKLMAWGMFKKVVIADRLSELVNMVFSDPHRYTGPGLFVASVFFTFQIYCDFSGYSDIAIGASEVLGIKMMQNFNRPFLARSVSDFWHRWHISLSTWFRDYLYITLGGSRVSIPRWYYNLFIVFLISGLWHGASWTFVAWGAFHGAWIVLSYVLNKPRQIIFQAVRLDKYPKLLAVIQILFTFSLVNIGYIFFRATSISNAFYHIKNLFNGWHAVFQFDSLMEILAGFGIRKSAFVIDILLILFLVGLEISQRNGSIRERLSRKPSYVRWFAYYALILGILLLGVFNNNQFIYFQF